MDLIESPFLQLSAPIPDTHSTQGFGLHSQPWALHINLGGICDLTKDECCFQPSPQQALSLSPNPRSAATPAMHLQHATLWPGII